jgi:hypothetical protein
MDQLGWKLRLVILWLLQIINYFTYILFFLFSGGLGPGGGNSGGGNPIGGALTFLVMCIMVWLSLILKPAISRWPSIVLGALLAYVKTTGVIDGITSSSPGIFITEAWGLAAALFIIWYGIKIPPKIHE